MAYPGEKVYTIDGKKMSESDLKTRYQIAKSTGDTDLSFNDWVKKKQAANTKPAGGKGPSSTVLNPLGSTFGS